ncbi:MAG: sce7726 family protein [Tannerella sp.]|jgi:hypothetical protein|nr:sce7726 family protein [Tannerella sp.]
MYRTQFPYNQEQKLRSYSSIFSRMSLNPIVESDDCSVLNIKISRFDSHLIGKKFVSYLDYLKFVYAELRKNYRCEYIYKNTLLDLLIKEYETINSLIVNEFKVGNSVADMVLFNGTSKAYEIKTELDSNKRLDGQLLDYSKIFQESYIVTHESLVKKYETVHESVGIIVLTENNGKLNLKKVRPALENEKMDVNILIRSIRTNEYKNIVQTFYGFLPEVNSFEMFESCKAMMSQIPSKNLHKLFLSEMRKRKSNNAFLKNYQKELRHFCLNININEAKYDIFSKRLNKPINI